MLPITDYSPGETCVVARVLGSGAVRRRLLDMGILPNIALQIERVALTGDPIWIRLHGFQLSLRRSEAEAILAVPEGTAPFSFTKELGDPNYPASPHEEDTP